MTPSTTKKIPRLITAALVLLFILIMIIPVSAELRTISQGNTVFIGETNLDFSSFEGGVSNEIGWWASAASLQRTSPTKSINLEGRYSDFTVTPPSEFVGYTGNWYFVDPITNYAVTPAAFIVTDPTLDMKIWDFQRAKDISGMSILQGAHLGMRIDTNMYRVTSRPNANAATDGYINIKWKGEDGHIQNNLLMGTLGSTTSTSTLNQYVNTQPWTFGTSTNYWVTDATDAQGQYVYPAGTYEVWAESALNNMMQNYKNAGADYTGKTISQLRTVTLLSYTVKIAANKAFVVRGEGKTLAVTVTGAPESKVDIYINGGDVSGITPPAFSPDSYSTLISPGHIQTQTSKSGTHTVNFVLSEQTTPQVYSFKAVGSASNKPTDQVNVEVLLVAPTPTPTPTLTKGSILFQSNPVGATIFLDNAIKGITPLTIYSVPNGDHTVLLRLDGYQDYVSTITVSGESQTINPTLSSIHSPTTIVTSVPTTASVTSPSTTIITQTPIPTATVNHSATIEALQKQIDEQNARIEEQESWIDMILRFLGLK